MPRIEVPVDATRRPFPSEDTKRGTIGLQSGNRTRHLDSEPSGFRSGHDGIQARHEGNEKDFLRIEAYLIRHERLLAALPEAIKEKIGFN